MQTERVSNVSNDNSVFFVEEKKPVWITKAIAEQSTRDIFLHISVAESILFTFFVIISTFLVVGMVFPSMFFLTKIMRDEFTEREFQTTNDKDIQFGQIRTPADFWAYLEHATSNSFYWDYWYDREEPVNETDSSDKNIIYENKLLGVPRIRQLKVKNDSCDIPDTFQRSLSVCYGEFSKENEDKATFGPGDSTAWKYSPSEGVSFIPWNIRDDYDEGGFYQDLSSNRNATLELIQELKENLWISRGTRAVFLDFTVYNANLNLFCVVKLIFEFPPTGGILPSARFNTLKLIRYVSTFDYVLMGFEIVFICFVVHNLAEEIREAIYLKGQYFQLFWNWMDVAILLLSSVCVLLAVLRYLQVEVSLKQLENMPEKYMDFERAAKLQVCFNNYVAVLLFLIYMKIFKYITFNKMMAQLNNTIKNCASDIMGFSVMFFIIFVAFAELGYLIFGTQVENYSTFGASMFTLLMTILGEFDYEEIQEVDDILAPIYFVSFIFLVFFVLLNMFLAIINDTYTDVKTELTVAPDEMQVHEYLKRGYFNLLRFCGWKSSSIPTKEMKNEYNVTVEEIRGALKKCGFTDMEIEMFFSKYNIDPMGKIGSYSINDLIGDLEAKPKSIPTVPEKSEKLQHAADGTPLVSLDNFLEQQKKLDSLDNSIQELTVRVKQLLEKLDQLESIKKTQEEK